MQNREVLVQVGRHLAGLIVEQIEPMDTSQEPPSPRQVAVEAQRQEWRDQLTTKLTGDQLDDDQVQGLCDWLMVHSNCESARIISVLAALEFRAVMLGRTKRHLPIVRVLGSRYPSLKVSLQQQVCVYGLELRERIVDMTPEAGGVEIFSGASLAYQLSRN